MMDIFTILSNINKVEEKKIVNLTVVKELINEYEIKNIRKKCKKYKKKTI